MEAVTGADLSFVNLGITIEHLPKQHHCVLDSGLPFTVSF